MAPVTGFSFQRRGLQLLLQIKKIKFLFCLLMYFFQHVGTGTGIGMFYFIRHYYCTCEKILFVFVSF